MDATDGKISDKANDKVDFDDLLTSAGEWGRYQWILVIYSFPFFAFGTFSYFSQLFITETSQSYWCRIPDLENLTEFARRDLGIPKDDNARFGYSQCEMYAVNWTDIIATEEQPNKTWKIIPCQYGWEFNKTEIPYPTIGSDFGWVCEKRSYQATAQAIFFVGCMIGGIIFGWVADRFGRIPAITGSCLIGCVGGFSSTFARNFIQFTAARFVMGMSYDSCMVIAYILLLEYVAPKYRTLLANLSFAVFYSLFLTAIPWIALACGHWKTISLVTSIPLGLGAFAKLFLPESPRWLISKGQVDEAIEKVLVISGVNKKIVPTAMINHFKLSVSSAKIEQNQKFSEIFKKPILRKMFILMCLEYMCSSCLYDGIVRCIGLLNFDFFISFTAIAISVLPSVVLVALIMDYTGRRWLCIQCMALCSIFFIMIIFGTTGLQKIIFAVIATFATNMIFIASLQWLAELLPTPVRGSGVAIIHLCGYLGTILSPYIVYLEIYFYWLPLAIFGVISALAMLVAFSLPETAKRSMLNTFEEAEELSKNQRPWSFSCLEARKNKNIEIGQTNQSFEFES